MASRMNVDLVCFRRSHSYENRLAHSRLLKQKQDNSLKKYQDEITAYRHEVNLNRCSVLLFSFLFKTALSNNLTYHNIECF